MLRLKAILEDMQHLIITALRPLATPLTLPPEQYLEQDLHQLLREHAHQAIIGWNQAADKLVGVWLMEEHMLAGLVDMEDIAYTVLPVIRIIPLPHQPLEGITVVVSLGILFYKSVLTALVREDSHGMDQNVHHSPPQVIPEAAITIIILHPALISTGALRVTIGTATDV